MNESMTSPGTRNSEPGTALYICHCGQNIASTVDVAALADAFGKKGGISVARHYPYLCSSPGQELIRQDLRDGKASRVVVAACSPRMHENTFRKAVAAEGLNPYLFCHINIREQCSWVHPDRLEATTKASGLISSGLARVQLQEPLHGSEASVVSRALVVGGGPAGLTAAAELAQLGIDVTLVESAPHLGGRARDLGRSFPEGGAVGPWLEEKIREVTESERVEVLVGSRLVEQAGAPGSFEVKLDTPSGSEQRTVGAVIVATGYDLYRPDNPTDGRPELGYGTDTRIVTQEWLEGALRAEGEALEIEGAPIRSAIFLQCIGSRDRTTGGSHCSRVCCMVSVRQAEELRARNPDARVQVLYMDLRAYARGAEEAYENAARKGVIFRRGSASEVFRRGENRVVRFEDTLLGQAQELETDLVVLACGARPRLDGADFARTLRLSRSPDGFYLEAHPKLRPVETASDGIFLAGACQAPRTLDEAVASGRAAAVKAAIPLLRGWVPVDPVVAEIDVDRCAGCGLCAALCPAGAITPLPHLGRMTVSEALCKGCGACAAVCPSNAASLRHNRAEQLLAEVCECVG